MQSSIAESARQPTCIYTDRLEGFSIEVPVEWHVVSKRYEIMHYSEAFFSVNNRSPDPLPDWISLSRQGEKSFVWPPGWGSYLEPGSVVIVFTHEDGPCCWTPAYSGSEHDPYAAELTNALASGFRSVGDVKWLDLRFTKWSRSWRIVIWMREPFESEDRERVITILKSLHFMETPISSPDQAVGRAIAQLPRDVQEGPWPAISTREGAHETNVVPVPGGYWVEFILYRDVTTEEVRDRWTYRVQRDGSVKD